MLIANATKCGWEKSCKCVVTKRSHCEMCKWYYFIDSGFGYCKALPVPLLVAWCKDTCSIYSLDVRRQDV